VATAVRLTDRVRSLPLPLLLLAGLILARLLLALWWLIADDGVVDTESGRHLQRSWDAYVAIGDGDVLMPFGAAAEYPPLQYLVGALGAAVAGLDVESFIGAQTLFFVPALAIGCYGAGRIAYGETAGLLAAVFALGAPMAVSVFHMYLIDTTQAAMVAVSVWAILASDRFSRTGVAALAGVAVGLGMLSKQNFPVFVLGLLIVVIARGGWRHWRGLLAFAAIAAALSATWYWSEIDRTLELIRGASAPVAPTEAAGDSSPDRWSSKSFGFYVWSTFNVSLLLPLTLFSIGGGIALLVHWAHRRGPSDLTPELVVGGLFSYVALVWIALKDPRYALPALVYLAVLGTGWIPLLRVPWRTVAAAAVCVIALINVVGTVADSGAPTRISLPGAPKSGLGERQFTLYSPGGWIRGKPETTGAALDVMRRARDVGIERIAFDPGANQSDFNHPGLDIMSRVAGLPLAIPYDPRDRDAAMLLNRTPQPGDPEPCALSSYGVAIYLSRGPVELPFEQRRIFCPDG
jgi:4-amino-4-deoxy-L-arabinose transferase-like glycosyltransferase